MSRLLLLLAFVFAGVAIWEFSSVRASCHPAVAPSAASNGETVSRAQTLAAPIADQDSTPPGWVLASPEAMTGSQSPAVQNACQTADSGFGSYRGWEEGLPIGQMLLPDTPAKDAEGNVRLVFHFHGHEAVRKEWVKFTGDVVLVALDFGNNSSAYGDEFADPSRFTTLLEQTQRVLDERAGHTVAIGQFVLSAWSAGYAAVRAILDSEYQDRVEGVILLDGLHTTTLETATGREGLTPFVQFARRAAQNEALMFVSHSSIDPPEYTSTTQATSYLVWSLGGRPRIRDTNIAQGLTSYRRFDLGGFHALGFAGVTKEDHCAQVMLYGHVLQTYLLPRWGLSSKH